MAVDLSPVLELDLGSPVRQFRFVPLSTGEGRAFLAVHANCAEVDPYHRMFFLPTDTLKLTCFDTSGKRLWQRDMGPGVIPGIWFCPVFPFDVDGNGADDIWVVGNSDPDHALDFEAYILERMSPVTGEVMQAYPWPQPAGGQDMSRTYRNFINGGFSHGRHRLITCQGTYGPMQIQCYDSALQLLWSRMIGGDEPGARGSHMFPVVDIDGDGRDELLWGERCMDIDTGRDIWIGDAHNWKGHSDVIQPTLDRETGVWRVYTCREARKPNGAVVMFDGDGKELWGLRGLGHMDMGWTARLGENGRHWCYALEIGEKSAGPGGFRRGSVTEYLFDVDGERLEVDLPLYQSLPVDFDGDGAHELMYTGGDHNGHVRSAAGETLYQLEGSPAYAGKLLDAAGEQIVTTSPEGLLRLYTCPDAEDSPAAKQRYAHPYYAACLRLWAMAYNRTNLGGL
ncbi:MAG TPA: hypothetical protein VM389_10860 [Phycisphaerae bacterium]|nr:hypothetical protein [Phycisphaerae bacterium]